VLPRTNIELVQPDVSPSGTQLFYQPQHELRVRARIAEKRFGGFSGHGFGWDTLLAKMDCQTNEKGGYFAFPVRGL